MTKSRHIRHFSKTKKETAAQQKAELGGTPSLEGLKIQKDDTDCAAAPATEPAASGESEVATPETDRAAAPLNQFVGDSDGYVVASFCRNMERQRNALQRENESLHLQICTLKGDVHCEKVKVDIAESELASLTKRLEDAGRELPRHRGVRSFHIGGAYVDLVDFNKLDLAASSIIARHAGEIEGPRTDTERLDYLDQERIGVWTAWTLPSAIGRGFNPVFDGWATGESTAAETTLYPTVRDAIDASRSTPKEPSHE